VIRIALVSQIQGLQLDYVRVGLVTLPGLGEVRALQLMWRGESIAAK
jgi:hypothetical protein